MIFLTKTNQSIFLCDVTTELTATVLGRDNSLKKLLKSFVGIKTSYKSLQEFFCCLKKTNPHEFVGFKNLLKNLYVKTTHKTKQGCVALSEIIRKSLNLLLHNLLELSRVFSCFGRNTKNGHVTLPIKGLNYAIYMLSKTRIALLSKESKAQKKISDERLKQRIKESQAKYAVETLYPHFTFKKVRNALKTSKFPIGYLLETITKELNEVKFLKIKNIQTFYFQYRNQNNLSLPSDLDKFSINPTIL
jgi:hypothetical protein